MTVQELIDILQNVEDKTREFIYEDHEGHYEQIYDCREEDDAKWGNVVVLS